jgi:hypothetical protein
MHCRLFIKKFYYEHMSNIPMYSPIEHVIGEYADSAQVEPFRHGITISEGQNVQKENRFRLEYIHWELPGKLPVALDSLSIRAVATLEEARVASRTLPITLFDQSYRMQKMPRSFSIGNLKTVRQPVA